MHDLPIFIPRQGNHPSRRYTKFPGVTSQEAVDILWAEGIYSLTRLGRMAQEDWETLPGLTEGMVTELVTAINDPEVRRRGPR